MKYPSMRLRMVVDNCAIAILCAALAMGVPADWLWWPLNTDWFLWMTCGLSACLVVNSAIVLVLEKVTHERA